jgi:hypothetical protein
MIAVPGIYENDKSILLAQIPDIHRARVVITVLEELPYWQPAKYMSNRAETGLEQ